MVKKRGEADKKAAQAISAMGERPTWQPSAGPRATAIAEGNPRLSLPIGEPGEQVAKAFLEVGIKVGAEQAAQLRAAVENRLHASLDPKQFDIFLHPNEQLALAFGEGLKKLAESKPLIIVLDTYEIVDRADLWVRVAMREAGPASLWVISGRNNLVRSGQFGSEYFKGYANEFPRRLLSFDMLQLAEQDIRELFAERVAERALDQATTQAIARATAACRWRWNRRRKCGRKASRWSRSLAISTMPHHRGQIVSKMTERYLMHVVAEANEQALYALALAHGDSELLPRHAAAQRREALRPGCRLTPGWSGIMLRCITSTPACTMNRRCSCKTTSRLTCTAPQTR